jgi:hypothetical protein
MVAGAVTELGVSKYFGIQQWLQGLNGQNGVWQLNFNRWLVLLADGEKVTTAEWEKNCGFSGTKWKSTTECKWESGWVKIGGNGGLEEHLKDPEKRLKIMPDAPNEHEGGDDADDAGSRRQGEDNS